MFIPGVPGLPAFIEGGAGPVMFIGPGGMPAAFGGDGGPVMFAGPFAEGMGGIGLPDIVGGAGFPDIGGEGGPVMFAGPFIPGFGGEDMPAEGAGGPPEGETGFPSLGEGAAAFPRGAGLESMPCNACLISFVTLSAVSKTKESIHFKDTHVLSTESIGPATAATEV